jgi:hypothetical protein
VTASVHGKKETTDLNTWHARLAHQDKTMVQRLIKNSADVDVCQEYAECSVSAPNIVMQTCAAGTTHDVIP